MSLDLGRGRIRGGHLVWPGRLRAACGQRRLVHVRSGEDSPLWDLSLIRVFDSTIVDKFAVLESVKKVAVCSCRGQARTRFRRHVFRFSHRRRYRPQLLHGPRWLARGILQVHSSANVQSATARDEGASGAATIYTFGY